MAVAAVLYKIIVSTTGLTWQTSVWLNPFYSSFPVDLSNGSWTSPDLQVNSFFTCPLEKLSHCRISTYLGILWIIPVRPLSIALLQTSVCSPPVNPLLCPWCSLIQASLYYGDYWLTHCIPLHRLSLRAICPLSLNQPSAFLSCIVNK